MFQKRQLKHKKIESTILNLGYSRLNNETFIKESTNVQNLITLKNDGIKIRVWNSAYGESDFLRFPLTDINKLKLFIKKNEV